MMLYSSHSLEEQRLEFSRSRFLAVPIAGTMAWTIIGPTSPFVPVGIAAWILFICTGVIFALALLITRFLGEDHLCTRETTKTLKGEFPCLA